ncbi:MAG TPA: GNAT family N-acetyltransferase [Acidimicrobiales bacterium]|nr:GNAT family N-acetyltransferase [Acidimicrobiales bacterium]
MAPELRPMADGEQAAFARSAAIPFLDPGNPDGERHWTDHLEVGRAWLAVDGDRVVGNCCTLTRDVVVPDGAVEPFAAVSGIGVHPTHRRQGLLGRMMAAMLDDARRRGEAFAMLWATESVIYGRLGFGAAVHTCDVRIDRRSAAFDGRSAVAPADVTIIDAGEAAAVLPGLHAACRRRRAGEVDRNAAVWRDVWADPPGRRGGGSQVMFAVTDGGYCAYRAAPDPRRLVVRDLQAVDDLTEAALFAYLAGVDLVERIDLLSRPLDDPLRWRLADPRRLETTRVGDLLWLRVLDVPAALTGRAWPHAADLVLDVRAHGQVPADDPAVGLWHLTTSAGAGAACEPAPPGAAADLVLGLADLGALHMGGVAPSALAAAGRMTEVKPGALARADALWPTVRQPGGSTTF